LNKKIENISIKLAKSRFKNKFITRIPKGVINNIKSATAICRNAENELLWNPIGFKAGATNKSMWKKLKAKKPFFLIYMKKAHTKIKVKCLFKVT
jgi:hypothetical protein